MEERSFNDYILENTPPYTGELICVHCCNRWIGCWPAQLLLKDIVCPHCNKTAGVISTGQMLPEVLD